MIEQLNSIDRSVFLLLNSFHISWLDQIMVILSGQIIWVPFIICFIWMALKKFTKPQFWIFLLLLLLTIVASDVTSSYIIKNLVMRFRPCREAELLPLIYNFGQKCGGKYGFVSSHAANSFALIIFSLRSLGMNKIWWTLGLTMALFVSYSRIYLGVHYPGDILGGVFVGSFWSILLSTVYRTQGANR